MGAVIHEQIGDAVLDVLSSTGLMNGAACYEVWVDLPDQAAPRSPMTAGAVQTYETAEEALAAGVELMRGAPTPN